MEYLARHRVSCPPIWNTWGDLILASGILYDALKKRGTAVDTDVRTTTHIAEHIVPLKCVPSALTPIQFFSGASYIELLTMLLLQSSVLGFCLLALYGLYRLASIGHRPRDLPPGPPTIPLLGNIHQVLR